MIAADPTPEDAKLVKHFRAYLDAEFQRHPVYATSQGNHDHDDRMDDLSPAARAADTERTKQVLAGLPNVIDYKKHSRAGQIDYEIWKHSLEYGFWQTANDDRYTNDPRVYGEYISDSVFSLLTQSTQAKERNVAVRN